MFVCLIGLDFTLINHRLGRELMTLEVKMYAVDLFEYMTLFNYIASIHILDWPVSYMHRPAKQSRPIGHVLKQLPQ